MGSEAAPGRRRRLPAGELVVGDGSRSGPHLGNLLPATVNISQHFIGVFLVIQLIENSKCR